MDSAENERRYEEANACLQDRLLRAGWVEQTIRTPKAFGSVFTPLGSEKISSLMRVLQELGYQRGKVSAEDAMALASMITGLFSTPPTDDAENLPPLL